MMSKTKINVADFFSCGGGASVGFARRQKHFSIVGAVDFEVAKPSSGSGSSECNATYETNIGLSPMNRDIFHLTPVEFCDYAKIAPGTLGVMISCAPCTELSRAKPSNHHIDSPKNGLIGRCADFAEYLRPEIIFMENARELITGKFRHHHHHLRQRLELAGYDVVSGVDVQTRFGLPQARERSLIVASRIGKARSLDELWNGWEVNPAAVTVRSAMNRLEVWRSSVDSDPTGDTFPGMTDRVGERIKATPKDGGSWLDLAKRESHRHLLTKDCLRRWANRDFGSHPDIYGRMWLDRPAPTIKRECAHLGNGRYAHPQENRLLSVREMATLQGFPFDFQFPSRSISNRYRHIGDAVPPLISWQLSALALWMKTGVKPDVDALVMPKTCFNIKDLRKKR
jgi:DNA (cytosine-5)-methyltransferase 1